MWPAVLYSPSLKLQHTNTVFLGYRYNKYALDVIFFIIFRSKHQRSQGKCRIQRLTSSLNAKVDFALRGVCDAVPTELHVHTGRNTKQTNMMSVEFLVNTYIDLKSEN